MNQNEMSELTGKEGDTADAVAKRMLEALMEVESGRRGDYTNWDGDHILVCLGGAEINLTKLIREARGGS